MGVPYVVVLADEHPDRDEWVDEHARAAPGALVEIGDETYQGLCRLPTPERPLVHLFADKGDVPALIEHGLTREVQ